MLFRSFQHLLLLLLLNSLLLEVDGNLGGDLSEFCLHLYFGSDLFFLCIIGVDDLAFDLLLKFRNLSELLPLVPQLFEQLSFVWTYSSVDVDLRLGERGLPLLLLLIFCSVFLRLGAALHITINLS